MFKSINLKTELEKQRGKIPSEENIIDSYKKILRQVDVENAETLNVLKSKSSAFTNDFIFDELERDAIFHLSDIKKICIDYRLRFLDTVHFKETFPEEAIVKIKNLERLHDTTIGGFKIVAPMEIFKLKKADDPLLFAPMGNGYYYLIHQWGNDLHPLRKLKYWAIKNIENLVKALLYTSVVFTILTYSLFFTKPATFGSLLMLFMFFFKGAIGMVIILWGSLGKNFSEYSWQSQYDRIN
jgi:hypothetical protein